MFKAVAKLLLCLTLLLSMISAAIPLHNIFHKHHFVQLDDCGLNTCDKHIKKHTDHCHTHSDAVFYGTLPQEEIAIIIIRPIIKLEASIFVDNDFQFYHLTKNKAPPLLG